jgi:hypothetical protein
LGCLMTSRMSDEQVSFWEERAHKRRGQGKS